MATLISAGQIMILGIDESGRGPVIGDMVISGVLLPSRESESLLAESGIRDSKELSRKRREHLYPLIEKVSKRIITKIVPPSLVDSWRSSGRSLNELEAQQFAEIIKDMNPNKVYVDCASAGVESFRNSIARFYGKGMPAMVCEHLADKNYTVVSAASIVAKVTRDRRMNRLCTSYGNVGSGYCHDRRTLDFLESWYNKNGSFPPFVRKTWYTACRIREAKEQTVRDGLQSS